MVVIPAGAQATKPLDADCDFLQTVNDLSDVILDDAGVEFKNLGASASIKDFTEAAGFFSFVSVLLGGPEINLESASQFISTNAKCGLTKFVIDNLRD